MEQHAGHNSISHNMTTSRSLYKHSSQPAAAGDCVPAEGGQQALAANTQNSAGSSMHGNETELFLLSPEQPFPERTEPLLCSVQEKWCTKLGNANQPSPGTEQVG